MAVIENRPSPEVPTRLFTVADLAAMPTELPSGPISYELANGRLVMMSPTGDPHSAVQAMFCACLVNQGVSKGYGKVRSELGVILSRNPDSLLVPDVAFFTTKSLPLKKTREDFVETIPDIVVEIRSKNDSLAYLERKIEAFLAAGVTLAWLADPAAKTIRVYRRDSELLVLNDSDTLTADEIIPGFSFPVGNLFSDNE